MSTKERKSECSPVEAFIWDCVEVDSCLFEGIKKLSFSDLIVLRSLIDHEINDLRDKEEGDK